MEPDLTLTRSRFVFLRCLTNFLLSCIREILAICQSLYIQPGRPGILPINQLSLSHPTVFDSQTLPLLLLRLSNLLPPHTRTIDIRNGSDRYPAHYRDFNFGSHCNSRHPWRSPLRQGQCRYQRRAHCSGHVPLASHQAIYRYVLWLIIQARAEISASKPKRSSLPDDENSTAR
jgi:hypothetical protein